MDTPEKRGPEFYPPEEDGPQDDLPQKDTLHSSGTQMPPPEPEALAQETARPNPVDPPRSASILPCLTVLLAVAFAVSLAAYVLQMRSSQRAMEAAVDMARTVEQLQEDRDLLEAQRDKLETQLKELKKDLEQTNIELGVYMEIAGTVSVTEEENQCWVNFWNMEEEFLRGNYETCAEMFRLWYDSTYYMTPEPAVWRAEEIYDELVQLGHLDEDEPVRW